MRLVFAALMAVAVLVPPTTLPVSAETGDRTLYLYHTHTHEIARITFKRNGVYDQNGLKQLDWFLRDWRNNQPTTMAPQLFDLVWEIYQKVGATQPINVVSAYRSPVTNAYLHSRSSGVANNSQHMLGHAMDWFVPGVPLTRLRAVAMQQQVGGVGFYPTSGSPFVHTDVGTVRAWPRMTEAQLKALFPNGRTLHVASNGGVLSASGRAYAQAQWDQCHAVPCTNAAAIRGGAAALGRATMVAAATTSATGKTFADIHNGVNPGNPSIHNPGNISTAIDTNDEELADATQTAGPEKTAVTTVAVRAPIPLQRPAALEGSDGATTMQVADASGSTRPVPGNMLFPDAFATAPTAPAPIPARKSPGLMLATGATRHDTVLAGTAVAAVEAVDPPLPAARHAASGGGIGDVALGYVPTGRGTAAEHELQSIIENETDARLTTGSISGSSPTNSMGSPLGADALRSYAARRAAPLAGHGTIALAALKSFKTRNTALVAPDLAMSLVQPAAMSSITFAVFVEPVATDLSPATELGPMVAHLGFQHGTGVTMTLARFAPAGTPLVVAYR